MLVHVPLILKNSVRNKRRSILTIFSIAASLCLLALLMSLFYSFYLTEATGEQALRVVTRNRVSLANPLPLSYKQRIGQVPGVKEVMIFQWFGGTYKDARDPANFFGRFGVDAKELATVYPEYKLSDEERRAFESERTACIVGRKTANRHNMKIGDKVTIAGDIFPVTLEFTVRGIYDAERDNENLFFHYEYLNESMPGTRMDVASLFSLRLEGPEYAGRVAKTVDDMFRNSPFQTKTESEKAFELSFLAFLGNVKAFLLLIGSAVTFTILLVAGNTMAMSIRERVREVGVLKTLGFTQGAAMGLLLSEAVMISVIGGLLGVGLAGGVTALLRSMPSTFTDMSRIHVRPSIVVVSVCTAVLIGVASAVVPAYNASRKQIVDALRFTD